MDIVLIGSGNVATVFGTRLQSGGHRIVQVVSRTLANAVALATTLGDQSSTTIMAGTIGQLYRGADVYILALRDQAVIDLSTTLRLGNALVVHTAGSLPLQTLAPISDRYGVIYPLLSLRKEMTREPREIPLLIDGNDASVKELLIGLAAQISPTVQVAGDQERLRLHIAGVIVNNFPNYLYILTAAFLKDQGLDFRLLQPLLIDTVRRLDTLPPAAVQTGPAVRGDQVTLDTHLQLLKGYPELADWYASFSKRIAQHFAPIAGAE